MKYFPFDTALLAKTDNLHMRPSGPCVKALLERQCNVFNKKEYENLSNISISHIYNLGKRKQYLSSSTTFEKTCAVSIRIGERRKLDPLGSPGYLRVDSKMNSLITICTICLIQMNSMESSLIISSSTILTGCMELSKTSFLLYNI
ncbi:MAG: hypothetical protein PHH83_04725 [Patescibacteria group bacterium]|nr:hypothetical protein [Patescibacteria group bacterium]